MNAPSPGPWTLFFDESPTTFAGGFVISAKTSGGILCVAQRAAYPEMMHVMRANALVMTATPDLVAAAKAVLACREDGTFGPDGQQGFKMLEAALAKAGGAS